MDATLRYSPTLIVVASLRLTSAIPLILSMVTGVPKLSDSTGLGLLIMAGGLAVALLQFAAAEALLLLREIASSSQRAAAGAPSSLTPDEFESVIANALRETAPNPGDSSRLEFEPVNPAAGRRLVCGQCGKKIRVPNGSKYKPGDTARCPGCRERIVV